MAAGAGGRGGAGATGPAHVDGGAGAFGVAGCEVTMTLHHHNDGSYLRSEKGKGQGRFPVRDTPACMTGYTP